MAFGLKHTAPHTQKSEAGLLRILLGIFHDSVQRQTGGEGRGLVKVPTCTPGRVLTCTAQLQGPAPLGMAVTKGRARLSDQCVGMAAGAGLGLCPLPAAFLLHVGSSPLTHVCWRDAQHFFKRPFRLSQSLFVALIARCFIYIWNLISSKSLNWGIFNLTCFTQRAAALLAVLVGSAQRILAFHEDHMVSSWESWLRAILCDHPSAQGNFECFQFSLWPSQQLHYYLTISFPFLFSVLLVSQPLCVRLCYVWAVIAFSSTSISALRNSLQSSVLAG